MKIDAKLIARTSLDLLKDVGLEGLTMRAVAKELDVKAPALYWHVKGKQELLDEMAEVMFAEAVDGLESPRRDEPWEDWLLATTRRLRRVMLHYRDGARVFAGTAIKHPDLFRTTELTLRTLVDAGFTVQSAARGFPILLHYTVGFTIEEQARQGHAYADHSPYEQGMPPPDLDVSRYPLSAELTHLWDDDQDEAFDDGARVIIAGLKTRLERSL
ncbi:TetR/AcrR family transcriptional regulator C-terminal domain-containing protein [Phytomonospora endophytica]|uniref:TetR/AcrR family tetracycline transcriptional repressor n=1 Tax=Phytomonospora endophytica TaxID=714109 RepID=A0A841FN94_9ACTN|nr:TetR/AcrR family transcriptional regulator C-terminal domain-containing protein [Phytomonospora endophytica]MBB6035268.1 TetR/AcrR family tetracycline transcriptional repressor [Phytomonospora endophytica]GIG63983.1 putative transcriptional regulator, TetR family (tetracyclin resistance) [Phytomonospora endophytica]